MVQKKEPKQEQNIYSPYYYPNFSRYNYPSKIGGDEEQYVEQKFSFPHWDDEVQAYTPPRRRRASSSPLLYTGDDIEYFNNKAAPLTNDITTVPSDNDDDESEVICDKIQSDIDLARKDQKTDYDQFRKTYATFHDDIRALQREIEAIEAVCMKNGLDLKRDGPTVNDDGSEICYIPTQSDTCDTNGGSLMTATTTYEIKGRSLLALPSAAAAARSMIKRKRSSPSILYKDKVTKHQQEEQQNRENRSGNFNDNNNNRRCLGIGIEDGWTQDRVQNEWIRC